MNFKEKITEMVENVYDLARDGKYDVKVDLIPRKKATSKVVLKSLLQNTAHNIKWRSKTNSSLTRNTGADKIIVYSGVLFSNSIPKTVKCPLPTNLITNWASGWVSYLFR